MLYDFRCPKGHVEEHWVKSNTKTVRCKSCGEDSDRIISGGNFVLDPLSGDFPGATLKWAKHHEATAKQSSN
jgi:hypothetical protein